MPGVHKIGFLLGKKTINLIAVCRMRKEKDIFFRVVAGI